MLEIVWKITDSHIDTNTIATPLSSTSFEDALKQSLQIKKEHNVGSEVIAFILEREK